MIAIAVAAGCAVRPRRRRRGSPRAVPLRTDRPPRQAAAAATCSTTCAARTTTRPPSRSTRSSSSAATARARAATRSSTPAASTRPARWRPPRRQASQASVEQRAARRRRAARRPATRCSSPARRSATATRACCSSTTSTAAGIDARGASFPGSGPYVELGRGPDYSWSATSSGTDIIDQFVETLCDGSDTKYEYNGDCRDMTDFSAGTLGPGAGPPAGPVAFKETVHGPVIGLRHGRRPPGGHLDGPLHARTRDGQLARLRGLQLGRRFAEQFIDAASKIELSFNWYYGDKDNIAFFSSGRVPIRDGGVNMGLPTDGTGKHEWRGFVNGQGPPAGDQPVERADRQLEQQARDGLDRRGRRVVLRLGAPRRPAEQRDRARAGADDARRADQRDELRGDAGPPQRRRCCRRSSACSTPARRRARASSRCSTCSSQWRADRVQQARQVTARRPDRRARRGDHGPGVEQDRRRGHGPGARPAARRARLAGQRAATTPTARARPTAAAGTATSTRTSGRCSATTSPDKYKTRFCGSGDLAACRASLWQALKDAGDELQAAHRAATRASGARARSRSGSRSRRCRSARSRCAGRTGRPTSR